MLRSLVRVALILPLVFTISQAQTTTQVSPSATTLASQALQAAVGRMTLTDATLQGTVNYTAGSDEEIGTFTLEVKGNQESKLTLILPSGQRQEIRQGQLGAWVDTSGVQHPMAVHNCWVDASVLFPTFSLWGVLNDPQMTVTYLGQTVRDGVAVHHLQLSRVLPKQSARITAEIQTLSIADLYLNASTYLPVALDFTIHSDDDINTNFPTEVVFSGYQTMNRILVPTRVQKYFNGTLLLDMSVSSAAINSGLRDSDFAIAASIEASVKEQLRHAPPPTKKPLHPAQADSKAAGGAR